VQTLAHPRAVSFGSYQDALLIESVADMAVSIKDVARAAGVSPSTVSRAMNDHPRISQETKSRIRHLARELGYTPSLAAQSLVTRHTATIGMVVTTAADPFLARLVQGVEVTAEKQGYSVFLGSSYADADRELEIVRSFHARRASGVIITGSRVEEKYLQLATQFPLPIVLINCARYPYSVNTDNVSGARQAVAHLVELGHQHIAFVSGLPGHQSNLDRLAGYRQALREHGIALDHQLIFKGEETIESGVQAARQMLALRQRVTAFFCFNDQTAIGVIWGLRQAGASVPEDYSVVGFDDLDMAAFYCPSLTTVRQQSYRLGQRAINIVLGIMQGKSEPRPERLPADLIVRESTSPAPKVWGQE
jgi:LacI family repressor for deo operon, udp, cdd, tsx, nupC, and nupG